MAVFINVSSSLILVHLSTFFKLKHTIFLEGISKGTNNTNFLVTTGFKRCVLTFVSVNSKLFPIYFLLTSYNFNYSYYPPVITDIYGRLFFCYNGSVAFLTAYVIGSAVYVFNFRLCYFLGFNLSNIHVTYIFKSGYIFNSFSFRSLLFGYIRYFFKLLLLLYYNFLLVSISYLQRFLTSCSYFYLAVAFCHCDLFRDNVIFDSTTCYKFIDFHFLSFEKKLYDFSIVVSEWCFNGHFCHRRFIYFIIGYLRRCFISISEFNCMYIFTVFVIFRFFITRLSTLFYGCYTFSSKKIYSYYYLYNYFYFNRAAVCEFFSLLKRYIYVRFYKRLCFCAFKGKNQISC
ncbi:phosphotransferase [Candidatus Vidania fulgoroideae]|uniref:Phosphotransferase n=1 Tax=Candidatus Vidania fulgoroideorum TaxID=881286 RepID=A0A975AE33_9PROT|nr:phosphotransferase [Candidatus Vidania fulgoroideae]